MITHPKKEEHQPLTNIWSAGNKTKPETWHEIQFLHQQCFTNVKHWHCIYLQFSQTYEEMKD